MNSAEVRQPTHITWSCLQYAAGIFEISENKESDLSGTEKAVLRY